MNFDTTINLSNLITLAGTAGMCVTVATWAKITINRHEKQLYDERGNPRLVSFDDHRLMQENCRGTLVADNGHSKVAMERIEKIQREQNAALLDEIKSLGKEIAQLSKCVTLLSAGKNCD